MIMIKARKFNLFSPKSQIWRKGVTGYINPLKILNIKNTGSYVII